jgi:hypothetical protein
MATKRTPLEPDDLLDMPVPAHLSGYELVDGELVPVTPASFQHGSLIAQSAGCCSIIWKYMHSVARLSPTPVSF